MVLFLLAEELTIEENWAIGVAASCMVLLDGQGGRANFQPCWDGESCKLQRVKNATIDRWMEEKKNWFLPLKDF